MEQLQRSEKREVGRPSGDRCPPGPPWHSELLFSIARVLQFHSCLCLGKREEGNVIGKSSFFRVGFIEIHFAGCAHSGV